MPSLTGSVKFDLKHCEISEFSLGRRAPSGRISEGFHGPKRDRLLAAARVATRVLISAGTG
jgi:hypothetical protein